MSYKEINEFNCMTCIEAGSGGLCICDVHEMVLVWAGAQTIVLS